MASKLFIVTGASRGLGAAMAEQLLLPGNLLLCISRHVNDELAAKAAAAGAQLEQWPRDLADPLPVAAQLEQWVRARATTPFDDATLINNAGAIGRVGPLDEAADHELSQALRVGLEAALLLSAAFLRATRGWPARRKVLNISSGLGRHAMAGSALYCAAKAGMDHFSRAVALDEAHRGSGARIVSLAPGVIDTEMQTQLRASQASGFPDQSQFVAMKTQGQLATPQAAAARVLAYLQRADFGSKPVADVRDPAEQA
ncbi:MAG TPA: SDR family NAD(P)-dependent oxidoreductase [Albitalea sp.]|nr:SDR family NAD(P)-dependent oxidoreductase [Albitalea sp.]